MELQEAISWVLNFSEKLNDEKEFPYNPLTHFIPYVSCKETVHSKILAEFMSLKDAQNNFVLSVH